MLTYEPGDTILHRLDPRSKLGFQLGFSIAALAHPVPLALVGFTIVVALAIRLAGLRLWQVLYTYRYALVFLVPAPFIAAATLGPPWFDVDDGVVTALASYRALLIVILSAAYIRTTSSRESRAAIQRTIPGKPGHVLGVGVALLLRLFPVMLADIRSIRQAFRARLGDQRGVVERSSHLGVAGVERTFDRAERLAPAMHARCFAWNPTLPRLSFGRLDWLVLVMALAFALSALL